MSFWFVVVYGLLGLGAAMVLLRMWTGPSMLDRAVSLDALLSIAVAAIGALAAQRRTGFFLPILLVLAFLGFTGSVSVARFISVRDPKPQRTDERQRTGEAPDGGSGAGGATGAGEAR